MVDKIKQRLAQTMHLDESQILEYRQVGDGYTVILSNYQKYVGVILAADDGPAQSLPMQGGVSRRKRATRAKS